MIFIMYHSKIGNNKILSFRMKLKSQQDIIHDSEPQKQELKKQGNTNDIRKLNAPGGHNNEDVNNQENNGSGNHPFHI
jgi:hypothetical protein